MAENFFQWAARNTGEYLSGQDGWVPGQGTKTKVAQTLQGKDADWIPGVSVQGGDRSPKGNAWIGATDPAKTKGAGGGGGGQVLSAQNTPVYSGNYVDPGVYSGGQWYPSQAAADQAKRDKTIKNMKTTQSGYRDAAEQQGIDVRNKYQADVQKFLATIQNGQDDINSGRANNALNLRRSMSNIAAGIRQGIKSGGVQLANMNATDSGAADAMARAYATMGNQQAGDANNEAALKTAEFDVNQTKLNRDRDEGIAGFDRERDAEVSRIRGDLRNKLAALDAQGEAEGVTGIVDMGIVNAVVNEAVARLAAVDKMRGQRLGGVKALSANQVNQRAAEMDAAGMEGTSPFMAGSEGIDFGVAGESPMGAATSQLPQYARDENGNIIQAVPRRTDDQPVV